MLEIFGWLMIASVIVACLTSDSVWGRAGKEQT